MSIEIIATDTAPAAIGPYSQAIKFDGLIFCSGQIPLDPATGVVVEGGVREQAEQVMRNIEAVLKAAGSGFDKVVKATIFLTDMADFVVVNEVYGSRFQHHKPARSTVAVKSLPKEVALEIEVIAVT
ncbi:MAG: RidA family protein [Desulfuromonadaceae bacterium]